MQDYKWEDLCSIFVIDEEGCAYRNNLIEMMEFFSCPPVKIKSVRKRVVVNG